MSRPISPLPLQQANFTLRPARRAGRAPMQPLWQLAMGVVLLLMLMVAPGCGGGSGSSVEALADPQDSGSETGELIVTLTDAEGDFLTYTVDVLSLSLTRDNGDVVQALPLSTSVDFAELTEVTEFLTVATVPAGIYTSASIELDFTNHDIMVQDDSGAAVAVQAVDSQGQPLGVVDMRLQLTTSDVIRIARGIPAAFSLDFDLEASNEIMLEETPPVVVVDPLLLATPELEADRQHRVRGVLAAVDVQAQEVLLNVRPFRHRTGQFGEFTLHVNDNTEYDVDGTGYVGDAGLEALAILPTAAPVVALGAVNGSGMMADTVVAGSSVPWTDADVVLGVVAARSGDVLTVKGAQVEFADGRRVFRGTFTVNLTADTSVSAPGLDLPGIQSISVGQRITAWGEFSSDSELQAGRVRMHMNQLSAEVVQSTPLAVDLFALNGRRPAVYNFAGTGVSAADDADPAFYEIDTQNLNSPAAGELVRVRGLVNAFGAAPADFLARTIIEVNTDMRAAVLKVGWQQGTVEPFVSISPERIDVDLEDARKALHVRGVPRAFIDELTQVALLAPADGMGVYAVKVRGAGEVHVYRGFADLVDELISQLDAGRLLHRITSQGKYNVGSQELTTGRAGFVFALAEDQQ